MFVVLSLLLGLPSLRVYESHNHGLARVSFFSYSREVQQSDCYPREHTMASFVSALTFRIRLSLLTFSTPIQSHLLRSDLLITPSLAISYLLNFS